MITRLIKIWLTSSCKNSVFEIQTNNFNSTYESKENHWYVIVPIDPNNNFLQITCIKGCLNIGNIEINYSWKINPYFLEHYSSYIEQLEKTAFDLSVCSDQMLKDLESTPLWIDTGVDDFSATENLKLNSEINSIVVANDKDWHFLSQGDVFKCNVFCTRLPSTWIESKPELQPSAINHVKKLHYDNDFIQRIDTRFYSWTKKYVSDKTVSWKNIKHDPESLPYAFKMRIQAQLLDNKNLIEDKHIIDIGADLGQFTYPCVLLNCKSVTSAQIVDLHNEAIQTAAEHLNIADKIKTEKCDIYDLKQVERCLDGKDTILFLGVIYHINHHYQLLEQFSKSRATGIVIDSIITDLDFWQDSEPKISWFNEYQNTVGNGIELKAKDPKITWVGVPNASWIIMSLENLGWTVLKSSITQTLTLSKMRIRGIISAERSLKD
jgi:2-polyprenyl-3-methyl-5-hydroxy-6-metoxy-1,4-benzoquinol methylase